jgi:hypothetical protein
MRRTSGDGVVSAHVGALSQGALKTMLLSKLRIVCLLVSLLALGGGPFIFHPATATQGNVETAPENLPASRGTLEAVKSSDVIYPVRAPQSAIK